MTRFWIKGAVFSLKHDSIRLQEKDKEKEVRA